MLNTDHFVLIAGTPENLDADTQRRIDEGEELSAIQEDHYDRGRRSLELRSTLMGWVVASGTPSLSASDIYWRPSEQLGKIRVGGLANCLEWGIAFVNEDPQMREFYVRK